MEIEHCGIKEGNLNNLKKKSHPSSEDSLKFASERGLGGHARQARPTRGGFDLQWLPRAF